MPRSDQNWGKYLGLGLEMAVGVLLGYFVGQWLDRKFGWNSRAMIIGVAIGFGAPMYILIRDGIRENKE
jgi:F0F1-type ATP synthase assembly protein I